MLDSELQKLVEIFKSPIKNIEYGMNSTIIEFENGQKVPLYGTPTELNLNLPRCNFCGNPGGDNDPLFSTDDKNYICKSCTLLAVETFLNNGVEINLKLGNLFPEATEQLNKLMEKAREIAEQSNEKL